MSRSPHLSLGATTLLGQVNGIADYGMQAFWDSDYDNSCPCFAGSKSEAEGTVHVVGKCWRVSSVGQDLYVWGDHPQLKAIGASIKRALDAQEWYQPYTIIYGGPDD